MTHSVAFLLTGVLVGAVSGLLGLGGGIILIPILVLVFGFSQHAAQGTSTAMMIPPIGLMAAWVYYKNGHVHVPAAIWLCVGFFLGGLLGARLAEYLPELVLRRVFALFLMGISLRMLVLK
jgi:uncharacterized membrane protein YfcA